MSPETPEQATTPSATPTTSSEVSSGGGRLTIEERTISNERNIQNLEQKLENERLNSITIFGIFASLVTFLSVEIQVFKFIENFWLLIGLSSFLVSSLLLFVFSIHLIIRDKLKFKDFFGNPVFFIFLVFLIFSFAVLLFNSQGINIDLQVSSG